MIYLLPPVCQAAWVKKGHGSGGKTYITPHLRKRVLHWKIARVAWHRASSGQVARGPQPYQSARRTVRRF
jgi:hypothetical protein